MKLSSLALWGKLPLSNDVVQVNLTRAQGEEWRQWFERFSDEEPERPGATCEIAVPWSFVLSPGCLAFSGRHYVVGVMAGSCDKDGGDHPFVVFFTATRRWLIRYLQQPHTPLFWLARLLSNYVPPLSCSINGTHTHEHLQAQLKQLWQGVKPSLWHRLVKQNTLPNWNNAQKLLSAEMINMNLTTSLCGVPIFPWAQWPHCLYTKTGGWFWQQDDHGGYVGQYRYTGDSLRKEHWCS